MISVKKAYSCPVCGGAENVYMFNVFTKSAYNYTIRLCYDCRHELINCLKFVDSKCFKDVNDGSEVFFDEGNE